MCHVLLLPVPNENTANYSGRSTGNIQQDLTGLPSTSLAWGRGWHHVREAQGLSSVLVYYNNLLCLLTTLSTTYSRLVFKKY